MDSRAGSSTLVGEWQEISRVSAREIAPGLKHSQHPSNLVSRLFNVRQVFSVASLCSDQSFLSLCHRRRVTGLNMLWFELESLSVQRASICVYQSSTSRATVAAHPKFEVSSLSINLNHLHCNVRAAPYVTTQLVPKCYSITWLNMYD